MTIEIDVARAAAKWHLDPEPIQAIVKAEGNILKAVQCSMPNVKTREQALDIVCRSFQHRMVDFISKQQPHAFIEYMGSFWAPIGAANDPKNLNVNWIPNVLKIWGKL
jgi:hypothetical protein